MHFLHLFLQLQCPGQQPSLLLLLLLPSVQPLQLRSSIWISLSSPEKPDQPSPWLFFFFLFPPLLCPGGEGRERLLRHGEADQAEEEGAGAPQDQAAAQPGCRGAAEQQQQ